jgi:hypothetical protein
MKDACAPRPAILAILTLLAALTSSRDTRVYRCDGDGLTRTICCCPREMTPMGSVPTLSAPCCCQISELEAHPIVTEAPSRPATTLPSALVAVPGASDPTPVAPARWADFAGHEATAPPPVPILLRKQSLLI